MTRSIYELRDTTVTLGDTQVLGPLDLKLAPGSFLGIVGPNGSGKTTLLRALTGAVRPSHGEIELLERPLADYRPLETARVVGVVPQTFTLDFSFTVREMVSMGLYAQTARSAGGDSFTTQSDPVELALRLTGLTDLAGRAITRLSGGERQRALIAQTLAQNTPTLLLDEPLNNLDLNHQLETMQLLRDLNTQGHTVVVVLHDLNMAAQYCSELILLDKGRIVASGIPEDVLDPRLILEVFKTRVAVHRQGRRPYVTPVWSDPVAGSGKGRKDKVHVIAGGGAASAVIEELVMQGYAPSVGVVSVFDTDYATAQTYELEVVSAPPFEAFSAEAMSEFDVLAAQADVIIVAPVFFGRGNLAPLRTALEAASSGTRVIVIDQPPIYSRDLSDGEATELLRGLVDAGAIQASSPTDAVSYL